MYSARSCLEQYRQTSLAGAVLEASPHRLIALLLRGARERIQLASAALGRGDLARKAQAIGSACAIIDGLRMALDARAGGEIAERLDSLYEYSGLRLVEANAANDPVRLQEVDDLLGDIETAWASLPASMANASPNGTAG